MVKNLLLFIFRTFTANFIYLRSYIFAGGYQEERFII